MAKVRQTNGRGPGGAASPRKRGPAKGRAGRGEGEGREAGAPPAEPWPCAAVPVPDRVARGACRPRPRRRLRGLARRSRAGGVRRQALGVAGPRLRAPRGALAGRPARPGCAGGPSSGAPATITRTIRAGPAATIAPADRFVIETPRVPVLGLDGAGPPHRDRVRRRRRAPHRRERRRRADRPPWTRPSSGASIPVTTRTG